MNILIRFKEKIKDLFIKENIFYFLLASIIFEVTEGGAAGTNAGGEHLHQG